MPDIKFTRREATKPEVTYTPPAPPRPEQPLAPPRRPPTLAPPPPWPPRRVAFGLIVGLAALQTLLVWFTMGGLGMSWDEAYYFEPNAKAAQWLRDWLRDAIPPQVGADPYWEETWELPGVPRFVHGLSGEIFRDSWLAKRHLFAPLVAQRLLTGVAHGINCALVALLLLGPLGFTAALAGMLAYASMPHVFGHAHFAAAETLMATMTLLVTAAFLGGLAWWPAALLTGVLFGLALNTKFNLILLPLPLWIWAWWHHRERCATNILAMVFLAPVVWVLTWPWLWHNTLPRMFAYIDHFVSHAPTPVWFHGQRWGGDGPPAPWYYPLEMLAVTTPLPTVVFGALGIVACLRMATRDGRARLFLLLAAVPLAVASLPNAPRYDGVRLIFPALAPMALMVGVAVHRLREDVVWFVARWRRDRMFLLLFGGLALALLSLPGLLGIVVAHPHELSHHNSLAGGIRGATAAGYETTQWCEAINERVVETMNAVLPRGATIRPLALHARILEHYQRWGVLRGDLQFISPARGATDYHLIQARQGFFKRAEWFLWDQWLAPNSWRFGWPRWRREPEVPMVLLAQTGPAFEEALIRAVAQQASPETP